MSRATPSSFPPASSSQKSRRHRPSRELLLKALEILGQISDPLPPALPPSPPASRSPSPVPSSKRKLAPDFEQTLTKKQRTSSPSEPPRHHQPTPSSSSNNPSRPSNNFHSRPDPSEEDGEVREDISPQRDPLLPLPSNVPVRRPRRGHMSDSQREEIHDKYHNSGRALKYSGDTRLWSTYPTNHKQYRPLSNPPLQSSPYHRHGNLFARIELLDALINFAYSIWIRDHNPRKRRASWESIDGFLNWTKDKWQQNGGGDDREKAFLGLIWMIEGFIHGRMVASEAPRLYAANYDLYKELKTRADKEAAASAAGPQQAGTPAMLPSPVTNSANSTPTNPSRQDGTPPSGANGSSTSSRNGQPVPPRPPPPPPPQPSSNPPIHDFPEGLTHTITASFLVERARQSQSLACAQKCLIDSQRTLTLPILAKHFPRTFARMMYSSLSASDEIEPDIEDEEGELFWPGQLVTGEGIGWVCTMGKAMIKEFAKSYGYVGLEGVIPKPAQGAR